MILWYSLSHTSAVETCPPFSLSSQKVTLSRSPPLNILFISSKKNSLWSWQTSWLSNILLQNNKVDKSRSVCLTYMTLHFDRQKAANEVKMRNLMFCTKTAVKDVKCKFWEENWTRGRFTKCMFTYLGRMWLGQTKSETRMLKLKSLWYRDKVVKQSRTQSLPPPSCEEEDVLKLNVQFSLYPILNSSLASTPPCHNNQLKIISLHQSVSERLCFLIESKCGV